MLYDYHLFYSPKAVIYENMLLYLYAGYISEDLSSEIYHQGVGRIGLGFLFGRVNLHSTANIVQDNSYRTHYDITMNYVLPGALSYSYLLGVKMEIYKHGLVTLIYYAGYTKSWGLFSFTVGGGPSTIHITEASPASVGINWFIGCELNIIKNIKVILDQNTVIYGADAKYQPYQFILQAGVRYYSRNVSVEAGLQNSPFLGSNRTGTHLFAGITFSL
jgi:hypothetical protein